jgi:intein/homing endonuclease
MWRRTVPIATWLVPKGAQPVEDIFSGRPGCFLPGTPVLTSDGTVKEIENIESGQNVMSSSGSREAVGCYDYECNEDVIELKALGLPKIISTQKHKIPVYRKGLAEVAEIEAKDIRKGDYILTGFQRDKTGQDSVEINAILGSNPTNPSRPHPRTKLLPPSVKIDNKFLRLFGLYLAEGHAHKNTASWSYSVQEENTLVVETENLIRDIFGLETRREVFNNGIKVCCDSQTLSAFFKYLSGGGSNRRRIATEIFNSPASLLPLVGGWFDGDGSVHNYSKTIITEVASTSKDLIFQMYSILLDEKIPTNYRMQRRDGNHSDIHKLTLDRVSANLLSPFSIKINYKEGATSRQGFWFGDKFLRPIKKISRSPYKGKVYDLSGNTIHVELCSRRLSLSTLLIIQKLPLKKDSSRSLRWNLLQAQRTYLEDSALLV